MLYAILCSLYSQKLWSSLPHVLTVILLFQWGPQAAAAVVCDSKSVLENCIFGPKNSQISPRGPTMVGRGVCSPRGLASESGPRICYKHQFGLYKGKVALRHLTNRTTHFHLNAESVNPVVVKIHVHIYKYTVRVTKPQE